MRQHLAMLEFRTSGRRLIEITKDIADWVHETGIGTGLLSLHCRHTSASLLISENASSAVQQDLMKWLDKIAPEGAHYAHDDEGPDDMPAHIKSVLTGVNLSIPVAEGQMMLGTWQGVFLAEHRRSGHQRSVALHISGE